MAFDKAKAVRAAEKYLAQGKIPAAIQEYRRIAENDADDIHALNTLGDLYARVNEGKYAVACYRRVAEHYREQGFGAKAVAVYKKITRLDPSDSATALALAALYEQQGLMVDARAQYLTAADSYGRAGQSREALDILRRIANLDPSNTDIRLRLAEGYAKEDLPDLAAQAYTEAGERLAARGDQAQALDCFTRALAFRPALHAALQGLLSTHTALGTADEAAEVLTQAVEERPGDNELRAMLARAYVEAESAVQAERAADDLFRRDPSSFTLFFDVIRLYLRQGSLADAARLLGQVAEPSLSGKQESQLLELLQEVLARDPEQLDALRLLVRAYTWTRDEERLRTALERLADAAETAGVVEEERRALAQLVRLAPAEQRFASRLEALGGAMPEDVPAESPSFESFMLADDAFAGGPPPARPPAEAEGAAPAPEFEWNSLAEDEAPAPATGASPGGAGEVTFDFSGQPDYAEQAGGSNFQEMDFGFSAGDTPGGATATGAGAEQMLAQELESVDFYIEQGYLDIARDTLEMLEKQYGSHEEIERRRLLLPADILAARQAEAPEPAEFEAGIFETGRADDDVGAPPTPAADGPGEFTFYEGTVETPQPEPPAAHASAQAEDPFASPIEAARPAEAATPAEAAAPAGGIDPGLAAIFDEFREAVEEPDDADADYETHFQTGLAYREMGLLDQAVEEFQTAAGLTAPGDGTSRFLQCCNLLGHCFMQKGMAHPATVWFKKGLGAPGHTEDEYQALRFELGTAYEQMGDVPRAIEVFSEVYAVDVSYRGVAERLRELQKQKTVTGDK